MIDNTQNDLINDIISSLIKKSNVLSKTKYTVNKETIEYLEEMYSHMPFEILSVLEEEIKFILNHDADVLEMSTNELSYVIPLLSNEDRINLCFLHKEIYDYLDEIMV